MLKTTFCFLLAVGILALATLPSSAGLISHWPLDTDANDAIGSNHGTVPASVSFTGSGANGNTGGSALFTGGPGGIQVPHDASLNPADAFTVTAWVNPSSTGSWNSVVTSREDNGVSVNGYILYNTPNNEWDFWTGGGGGPGQWGRNIGPNGELDTWTHLAITYDGTTDTKVLWVNGENAAEVTGQGYTVNTVRPFNIGAGEDTGTNFFFTGNIDDVSVWDNALDQGQIQNIMVNGVPVPEPSTLILAALGLLSLFFVRRFHLK